MIKNKRLSSMFVFLAACSLMATGFTSQAASLQSETNHTTGIETADIQTTAMQTISEEFVASASEVTAEGQQMAAEETARREQEAKEQAEREAQAAKELQQKQELLASIIFCEAGNQPCEGQVAVGAVVLNRVNSGSYPNSI